MNWLALCAVLTMHATGAAAQPVPANTKCAFGVIAKPGGKQLELSTTAGILTVRLPADLKAVAEKLPAGQRVRVYYVIDDGALATQLEPLH